MFNPFSRSSKDDFPSTRISESSDEFAETRISESSSDDFAETQISVNHEEIEDIPPKISRLTEDIVIDKPTRVGSLESQVPTNIYALFHDLQFPKITSYLTYILEQKSINAVKDEYTALETALFYGYTPVIEFLLFYFPETQVNRLDNFGSTPLKKAFLGGNSAAIDMILNDSRLDVLAHNQGEAILKNKKSINQNKVDGLLYVKLEKLVKEARSKSGWKGKIKNILGF